VAPLNAPGRGRGALAAHAVHAALFVGGIVVVPAVCFDSAAKAFAFPAVYLACSGLLFGIFSQINHLNEASIRAAAPGEQPAAAAAAAGPDGAGGRATPAADSWAREQVETSNNFCLASRWATLLSNGLNYQIEHHLFPGLNHEHLPLIAPVVRATCREFGVHYKEFATLGHILSETAGYLRGLA